MKKVCKILTPGQIPIVALQLFSDDAIHTTVQNQEKLKEIIKAAVECGFNLAMQDVSQCVSDESQIQGILKAMELTGLKMLLGYSKLLNPQECESFVNGFKSYASLAGWYLSTIPKFSQISNVRDCYDRILENDPDHSVYIRLYQQLDSDYTSKCKSYLDYLRCLQGYSYFINNSGTRELVMQDEHTEGLKPMIWSNCFDPVSDNAVRPYYYKTVYSYAAFYKNLRYLRQISLESGNPFWAFCRCEKEKTMSLYLKGTPAIMRLMCYSALAYGAQGLIFSSYQQRADENGKQIFGSPKDSDGNRTEMWYNVQSLISEIRSYTHIFLGGQPVDIRHSGDLGIDQFNQGTGNSFGPCESISAGTKGVLHVLYKNKHRNYLIIVNHDIDNSQTVTLRFNNSWKIVEETPNKLSGLAVSATPAPSQNTLNEGISIGTTTTYSRTITVNRIIEPGGWLIYRYE